ncbi:unnamed protein product [Ascophyllum nodosum]
MFTKQQQHFRQQESTKHRHEQCNGEAPSHALSRLRSWVLRLRAPPLLCRCISPTTLGPENASVSRWLKRAVAMAAIIGVVWMYLFLGGGGYGGGPPPDTGEYGGGPPPDPGGYGGGPPPDTSPRVAVCFFGLTRSLRWTLPSVRHRLLDVLRESGMSVDTFVHTYDLKEVYNERAGEEGIKYSSYVADYAALNPVRSLVTNQDDFDKAWPEPLSLTHYRWNYPRDLVAGVIRNVFRAYWSMAMVWGLMAQHASEGSFEYDAVVLARPDVWFHVETDLPRRMLPLPERTVFLPSFDTNLKPGGRKNDRFAYGSFTTMRVIMNRIATLIDPNAGMYHGEIDSEWVFGHLIRTNNITVKVMEFPVTRVRLTRDIPKYDHDRVEAACASGDDPMACEMLRLGFRFPTTGN